VSPLRIAIVTDGLAPQVIGGMQSYSTQLAIHLAKAGAQVEVFHAGSPNDTESLSPLAEASVTLTSIPMPAHGTMPGHYVRELDAWSRAVRDELTRRKGIDWIYVQGLSGIAILETPAPHLPPVAINMHGLEMFQSAPSFRSNIERHLLRPAARQSVLNADLVFSLGGKLDAVLLRLGVRADRIAETCVGIPDDWILPQAKPVNRPRRFLFIGRNERRKGVDDLMQAVRMLCRSRTFEIDLIGPFPHSVIAGIQGARALGQIADRKLLMDAVDACDILVCPSHAEGMPTVILEGMARGLAIVATDVGAVSKLVFTNNGWLVEPGNAAVLARAMATVLDVTDESLLKMKQASIVRIEDFRWAQVAAATMHVLDGGRVRE
jgi:glycosyltransferase involved in cell wall biosynthesis